MSTWVTLRDTASGRRLFVHNRPFASLGIQIDFQNCKDPSGYDYLFEHLTKMAVNTVYFPVQWFVFEPERGRYDTTVVDHVLTRAREHDLHVSFLWFGTNQGSGMWPAPPWLKSDTATFTRVRDTNGAEQNKLCPNCDATLEAERTAFEAFLGRLAERDTDQRTILLQIENEPCLEMRSSPRIKGDLIDPWSFRCHCPRCDVLYREWGGTEREFSARSLARYFSRLLERQKEIWPALTYTNFLLNPQRSGEDLEIFLSECPELDLVGIDYYGFGPGELAYTLRSFARGRNVPFVAEHSTESVGDAGGNAFRAVCLHAAVAFSPWAIDHSFGWRAWRDHVTERPFVSRDGAWSDAAIRYGRALTALGAGIEPFLAAMPDDTLCFVSEGTPRALEERRWGFVWRLLSGPEGAWAIVRTGDGDFTLFGHGLQAIVEPEDRSRALHVEAGRWRRGSWETSGAARVLRESGWAKQLDLDAPTCLRVRVDRTRP